MTLVFMVGAWLIGLYLAALTPELNYSPLGWISAGMAVILFLIYRRDRAFRRAALCLFSVGVALNRGWSMQTQAHESALTGYNDRGQVSLIGVIAEAPEARERDLRLRIQIEQIQPEGEDLRAAEGMVLVYTDLHAALSYGDRVRVTGSPQTPPVFDTFSFRDHLARTGIFSVIYRALVEVQEHDAGDPFRSILYKLRDRASGAVQTLLAEPYSGLLTGITLGDETHIAPTTREAFNRTNTSHLIAISGSNMAILAGILGAVFTRLTRRKFLVALLTLFGLILYTLLVGASPSVVRAAVMSGFTLSASRLRRNVDGLTALAASVWVITYLNPNDLFDLGFQLSALATLALLAYTPVMTRAAESLLGRLFSGASARQISLILAETFFATLAANLTILPLILNLSGAFSPISIVVNALVAPIQAWIMIFGVITVCLGIIWAPLGQIPAWLAALPLSYSVTVIHWGAAFPLTPITLEAESILIYYLILAVLTAILSKPPKGRIRLWRWIEQKAAVPALGLVGIGTALLIWFMVGARPDGRLYLWFLDVGRGSAALIRTPEGAHILIDTGDSPNRLLTALGEIMPFYQRELDLLILTSDTPLQTDALPRLLTRYSPHMVAAPLLDPEVDSVLERAGAVITRVKGGYTLKISDGTRIELIQPPGYESAPLLTRVVLGQAAFILNPYWTQTEMRAFLESGQNFEAAALQLVGNGRGTLNPSGWFEGATPQVVFAAAEGSDTPDLSILDRLSAARIPIYRTDHHGTIELSTNGSRMWVRGQRQE